MVSAFCERLGWLDLETLVTRFQSRVFYGVRQEIVALTEIPYIKGKVGLVSHQRPKPHTSWSKAGDCGND